MYDIYLSLDQGTRRSSEGNYETVSVYAYYTTQNRETTKGNNS